MSSRRLHPFVVTAMVALACAFDAVRAARDDTPWFVRVKAQVRTTSTSFDLSVAGAAIANAVFAADASLPFVQFASEGSHASMSGNFPGATVEGTLHLILETGGRDTVVTWTVDAASNATRIELRNANTPGRDTLIGVLSVDRGRASVSTTARQLEQDGPLRAGRASPRLVLAHYYPWWDAATFADRKLADQPLQRDSTSRVDEVTREMAVMKAAGIDAASVSWQGRYVLDGWNHRGMLVALDAAGRAGMRAAVLLETTVANPQHNQDGPPADPETVLAWLTDAMRDYAPHPAYLHVNGRPVVLAYAANRLKPQQWIDVRARLRARGYDPLIIGENTKSNWLEPLDGQFDYASNRFTTESFLPFSASQSLRVRTFHLLPSFGPRRIWAATVSPGYDDTRIDDGRVPRVRPREGGAYYDAQWDAAIATDADCVLITSWNEWWENTHIEPSVAYGDAYLQRTRMWTRTFKRQPAVGSGQWQ